MLAGRRLSVSLASLGLLLAVTQVSGVVRRLHPVGPTVPRASGVRAGGTQAPMAVVVETLPAPFTSHGVAAAPPPPTPLRPATADPYPIPVADDTTPAFRPSGDPSDTTAEPVVLELRIGRLASRTVPAYRVRTEALLPLSEFLQMAEILFRLSPDGRLEASVDPGHIAVVVDARSDTMRYGRRRVRVEPAFKRFVDGELYLGTERLGDLLGLRLDVDWSALTVTVVDPSVLPVARRLQREAAREAFLRRRGRPGPELTLGLERPRWGGMVLDYSVFLPSADPLAAGSYTAAFGADLLGGSLEAAALSQNGIESGAVRWEGSWTGVWRDRRWLTQLTLGDGIATGPRLRHVQGVSLTNAPYLRPSLVGAYRYGGRLEPGWVIEAYRGGELIAFDSTDAAGGYGMDLPTYYGENPVTLVAYGPFGEVREFNQQHRVLSQLLPARRFEYGLSAGACRAPLCGATANADLRYGITRAWTARAGVEQLWRDSAPDLSQPYAALTGSPLAGVAIEVEALTRGLARAAMNYEPSLSLRVTGDVTAYSTDTRGPSLIPAGRLREWGVSGFVRPAPALPTFYVEGGARLTESALGDFLQARLGASYTAADIRVLPFVRLERTTTPGVRATRSFAGANAFFLPRLAWGGFLGGIWGRADFEVERKHGLRTVAGVLGRELFENLRLEVGARYQRELGGVGFVATLQTLLPGFKSVSAVDAPPAGGPTGSLFVQGAAILDQSTRRLAFAPGPAVERAGVTGRVFLDANANGRRDPDEDPVGGVRVRVGNISALSGADGVFRIWDLIPFEPVLVTVDSLSLQSPLLVPAFSEATVVPGPNRFRTLDVPIVTAGVVEGRVELATSGTARGLGGAGLLLTNVRTGARMAALTFSDGDFYVLGVKPGEYELRVDARVLDAFGVQAEPLRFTLRPAGDATAISGLVIRLLPRP